jgi:hypothetical protein
MGNVDSVVEAWFAAWRAADHTERRRLVEICWSENGVYQDPMNEASGREAIMELIGGFHERRPGARIDLASGIDHHHAKFYYEWKMFGAEGQMILQGIDYGELETDGRLRCIIGFFGSPPPLRAATS